ncbi:hypothetical protein L218DRAFT_960546 [Marasmius fiardii PR-910]|nr:hypothetical protein L218DRAFT_960546 [Marasmius fiardii PR-910]
MFLLLTPPSSMPLKLSSQWSSPIRTFNTRRRSAGDDDDDDDDDNSSHSHQNTDGSRHSSSTGSSTSYLPNPSGANNLTLGNKSNSGAIAGGVIGGLCGLALIVFFWWWRRRNHRSRSHALIDLDDEPKSQATSVTRSKELDQFLATPFIRDADNMAANEARTVHHNQGESYNQDQSGFNEGFQARNVSGGPITPSTHVQRIVSNPDIPSQNDDYAITPSLSQAAFIDHHQKRPLDIDHSTGPSSWKRAESQITRSKTFHTTSTTTGTSQGSEGGFNVNSVLSSSNSSFSRRSFDSASTTATEVTPLESRNEKRPPPEVRLSVEGLFVDGRRVSDAGNSGQDEVVNLQRRIEALTQENALLALHAEAPPAYQAPGERSGH